MIRVPLHCTWTSTCISQSTEHCFHPISVAISVAMSVAMSTDGSSTPSDDKACMLPAAVPKKKLEAEPGARRMRRKITWTRPDGTIAIKEIIYTQQHDQDKVCSALRVLMSGCVIEGQGFIHSHVGRSHKITCCMLTLCLVTTARHHHQCHWSCLSVTLHDWELPFGSIM